MTDSAFVWVPGQGPDRAALDRMARTFAKPRRPMGEAWFMGETRTTYPRLLDDLDTVPDDEIVVALTEIASGSSNFGPLPEWTEWFHYLLPRLVDRPWAPSVLPRAELLMTAFMAQHPTSLTEQPYARFRDDALATLGRLMMSPGFWPRGVIDVRRALGKWIGPNGVAGWYDAGGLLSASLFLCTKYLSPADVERWFASVLAIADPHWRIQIVSWLVGAHALLAGEIEQPSQFPERGAFNVAWDWSHALNGHYTGDSTPPIVAMPFLPAGHGDAVLRAARAFDATGVFETLACDRAFESIAVETSGLRERFAALYG